MAVPTQPTRTTIVTEALKKAGNLVPTSAEITRGEDEFLEEVKHEISQRKVGQWWILQETATIPTVLSQQRYLLPADFGSAIRDPLDIINTLGEYSQIEEAPIQKIDAYTKPLEQEKPEEYAINRGEIYLYPVPDAVYTLQFRYWQDITKVDYTSGKHAEILRKWRMPLVLGVYWKVLQDLKDEREQLAQADFARSVKELDIEDSVKKVSGRRIRVRANIVV